MEKTGLINKFLGRLHDDWNKRCLAQTSREQIAYEHGLKSTLDVLKTIQKQGDIQLIIDVEQSILSQELELYANSSEETNSIKSALEQLNEAKKAFAIVQNPAVYQGVAEALSSKRKAGGLPLDGFREFIKSHTTRFTNRLAAPLPIPEKNLLRQRKDNMRVAKELYIDFQRKALGIPAPSKDIGLER